MTKKTRKSRVIVASRGNMPPFLIIGVYAPEGMRRHSVRFVIQCVADACKGSEIFLDDAAECAVEPGSNYKSWNNQDTKICIPLILCEDRSALKRVGVRCPYEFIIERDDLLLMIFPSDRRGTQTSILGRSILTRRLEELVRLYGSSKKAIKMEQLQDWFAGTFRKYLFLDETVHGTSGVIDANNIGNDYIIKHLCGNPPVISNEEAKIKKAKEDARKLVHRFGVNTVVELTDAPSQDSLWRYKNFFSILYDAKFRQMVDALSSPVNERPLKLAEFYTDKALDNNGSPISRSKRLPRPYGDRARFVSPTGKLNILLIDDDPESSPLAIGTRDVTKFCVEDWKLLKNTFHVEKVFSKSDFGSLVGDLCEKAAGQFRRYLEKGLSFDIALIDLCLCDEPGGDLTGYTMIKTVRKYFPYLPIVVYSKFRDM